MIFSKFDLKSGFWHIQIDPRDRYKTAFTVPFGQYEWNVMPFGLKNAPYEFQKIMNDFNLFSKFTIIYIDDVLTFSNSIDKYLNISRFSLRSLEKAVWFSQRPNIVYFKGLSSLFNGQSSLLTNSLIR
jgi:hypothetical protein